MAEEINEKVRELMEEEKIVDEMVLSLSQVEESKEENNQNKDK